MNEKRKIIKRRKMIKEKGKTIKNGCQVVFKYQEKDLKKEENIYSKCGG